MLLLDVNIFGSVMSPKNFRFSFSLGLSSELFCIYVCALTALYTVTLKSTCVWIWQKIFFCASNRTGHLNIMEHNFKSNDIRFASWIDLWPEQVLLCSFTMTVARKLHQDVEVDFTFPIDILEYTGHSFVRGSPCSGRGGVWLVLQI